MPYLVGVDGPVKGQRFELQKAMTLGRAEDADIRIDDPTASRRHCRISAAPDGCVIEDLGSGNGTLVNDEVIQGATRLGDGNIITVANAVFRYATHDQPAAMDASVTLVDVSPSSEAAIVETIDVRASMQPQTLAPDRLSKAHQRLRTVLEIGNAVGTQLDMDKLLDEIMGHLLDVFPQMDRGFIMLKDDADQLRAKVARERNKKEPPAVSVSKHIISEAVDRGVAILSADAMGDQRFSAAMSVMNFQIRSMMCAPLITSDRALGIMHVDTISQDKRFTMDDLELFTAVANQTALAVGNAEMHARLLKRERMERDLVLARQVQYSFLPGEPPEIAGMEFCAHYNAALEVGGDFYDWIQLGDGRLGIVVGDVAGKGIPAALMMARMMSDVRFLALSNPQAGSVLAGLNDGVIRRGMDDAFVTVVFMILDPETRQLTIANAAHCPPIHRHGETGELIEIKSEIGFPIGAMPGGEYGAETIALNPGDTITVFTDGVTEAMNAARELYGDKRVMEALNAPQSRASFLIKTLLDDIHQHVGSTPQSDDLTILCFGVT